jgi:hypothetical protein
MGKIQFYVTFTMGCKGIAVLFQLIQIHISDLFFLSNQEQGISSFLVLPLRWSLIACWLLCIKLILFLIFLYWRSIFQFLEVCIIYSGNRGSAVGISTGYGLDDRVRVSVRLRIFTSAYHSDRLWGLSNLPNGTGVSFLRGKAGAAWSRLLISN